MAIVILRPAYFAGRRTCPETQVEGTYAILVASMRILQNWNTRPAVGVTGKPWSVFTSVCPVAGLIAPAV